MASILFLGDSPECRAWMAEAQKRIDAWRDRRDSLRRYQEWRAEFEESVE